jgi:CRP-like cAMP-binding protein
LVEHLLEEERHVTDAMDTSSLLESFSKYVSLGKDATTALQSKVIHRIVKKRQFILQCGDVCKHYSFVVEGCFRMYYADTDGKEHNMKFAMEGDWIADIGSFHSLKPSEFDIEAIETSSILRISREDLIELYVQHPQFDRHFRVEIENEFIELQKRVLQSIGSTAMERYVDFVECHPKLLNRISNVHIASYLGMTPEFLSKIRKGMLG